MSTQRSGREENAMNTLTSMPQQQRPGDGGIPAGYELRFR